MFFLNDKKLLRIITSILIIFVLLITGYLKDIVELTQILISAPILIFNFMQIIFKPVVAILDYTKIDTIKFFTLIAIIIDLIFIYFVAILFSYIAEKIIKIFKKGN